ncbi:MAG: hypothetical protein ACMG6H_05935 [Acidobacteriota bacterium]
MRNNLLIKTLITGTLLILAIPIGASAQVYRDRYNNRYDNRDRYDRNQYDQVNQREVRGVIQRLDNSAVRLQSDLNVNSGRRVLGVFWLNTRDERAISEIRNFRMAVRQFRNAANDQDGFAGSRDEARQVLAQGAQLDRYLRLRTGSSRVDADLSDLRSNLHLLADAYGLNMPY